MPYTQAKQKSTPYERDGLDWYVEPRWCDDLFFSVETPPGPIWDPACGMGTIVDAARERGLGAVGTDIAERPNGGCTQVDFLDRARRSQTTAAGSIVTNPPYDKASEFITAARLMVGYVAVLVRLDFLASQRRKPLVSEAARVWVLSRRPSMPPGQYILDGGKVGSGQHDFCWIVWDRTHTGPTQIGWIA